MFVLRTGLQGNGKTLNTIREVDAKAAKEERPVYYHNIRGFNPGADALQAVWTEFDKPHEWYKLPQNAIIVIDEAQTFFRVRNPSSAVPAYASALETMRHSGHELHCITQNPGLIDTHFRKLCNSHIHYVRGHKGKIIKRWEFERVNMDVEKRNAFSDGQATRILLDKKFFGVYQSVAQGSEHHMRFKPPRAMYVLIACVLFIGYFGYGLYERRMAPSESEPVAEQSGTPDTIPVSSAPPATASQGPLSAEDYVSLRMPRIPDLPSSAPVYDELTRPVSYPRLYCMSSVDPTIVEKAFDRAPYSVRAVRGRLTHCQCYTQQATRYRTDFDFCMKSSTDGYFDASVPDRYSGQGGALQPPGQFPPQLSSSYPPQPATPQTPVVNVVPYEKGRFLW
ncbi:MULTISPECIES: zonular occludens toxin domain-containing protein [unclassified Pseudomonas]|uniref:zonular occludens toxin domain-containing protein n=1 Tax=unclassified Pseudomonas TaxID=196821 RepID=UPI002447C6F8|nr:MULTISPECIES: zonular occludens toxin domain-containing protein [unclassified Pseudomonas]MDG9931024.1 zonular occludens toxin domain-containing protein [Pseudomonas sp. GD04042]MDH0485384.1 zonular occludens toxin domain-containing protein [Pseudomonas sp. GD04015]MDH0605075.1 zonular occludens toxin domain-containing protein [Pseudomonas sp. GD03869]